MFPRANLLLSTLVLYSLGSTELIRRDPASNPNICQLESPQPSGLVCGDRGYISKPFSGLTDNQTVDFSTCQSYCLERADLRHQLYAHCESFAFDTASNLCILYDQTLESQGFYSDDSSSVEFFSTGCYQCEVNCPDTNTDNLIENSGFELSNEIGPFSQRGGIDRSNRALIVSPGHNSPNALLCADQCEGFVFYRDLCEGQNYSFSIDVRHEGMEASSSLDYFFYFGNFDLTYEYQNTTDWQTLYYTFQASSFSPEVFTSQLRAVDGSKFYFDNVVVSPFLSPPTTSGSSLVTNGGFESGDLTPWSLLSGGISGGYDPIYNVSSPGLTEGNYSLYFSATLSPYNEYAESDLTLSQAIELSVGQKYLVSFDYKTSAYQRVTCTISGVTWSIGTQTNEIGTFTQAFTALSRTSELVLQFDAELSTEQDVVIDNVSILALA